MWDLIVDLSENIQLQEKLFIYFEVGTDTLIDVFFPPPIDFSTWN